MTCDRSIQLHAFHDDELSPADRTSVEAHLSTCEACRNELRALRQLSRRVEEATFEPLPAGLIGSIIQARQDRARRSIVRVSALMTSVAAMILIGTVLFVPEQQTAESGGGLVANSAALPSWESAALVPPAESRADPGSELAALAQWMNDGLSSSDQ